METSGWIVGIFIFLSLVISAAEIDKMKEDAKQGKLLYSETITLNTYASHTGYTVAYDQKGLIVFYYDADENGIITKLYVDFYSPKDDNILTASTTNIPKFKGKDANQVQFQGFSGKFVILKFRFPNVQEETIWSLYSFKIAKTSLERTDSEVSYNNKSLNATVMNGKVFIGYTDLNDKNYVVKLDISLKKVKTFISSNEKIKTLGRGVKEDFWYEDYESPKDVLRNVKVYKL